MFSSCSSVQFSGSCVCTNFMPSDSIFFFFIRMYVEEAGLSPTWIAESVGGFGRLDMFGCNFVNSSSDAFFPESIMKK